MLTINLQKPCNNINNKFILNDASHIILYLNHFFYLTYFLQHQFKILNIADIGDIEMIYFEIALNWINLQN